mgnify:CR=1 FL=1
MVQDFCLILPYLQEPGHEPAEDGALDPRLGTSSKAGKCTTCGEQSFYPPSVYSLVLLWDLVDLTGLNMAECSGHFGYLRLSMPCFHIGYFRATIIILQVWMGTGLPFATFFVYCDRWPAKPAAVLCLMKTNGCYSGRNSSKTAFAVVYFNVHRRKTDLLTRKNLFKKAHEMAKKHKLCPRCNAFNGRWNYGSKWRKCCHSVDHFLMQGGMIMVWCVFFLLQSAILFCCVTLPGTVKKDGPIRVTHDAFAGGWPGVGGSDVVGKSTDEHVMQFRADMEPLIEYDPEYEVLPSAGSLISWL